MRDLSDPEVSPDLDTMASYLNRLPQTHFRVLVAAVFAVLLLVAHLFLRNALVAAPAHDFQVAFARKSRYGCSRLILTCCVPGNKQFLKLITPEG